MTLNLAAFIIFVLFILFTTYCLSKIVRTNQTITREILRSLNPELLPVEEEPSMMEKVKKTILGSKKEKAKTELFRESINSGHINKKDLKLLGEEKRLL